MSGVLKCRYFRRRRPRQSTAALGLSGNSRKQGIDFSIVQALQRSGQVFRQQITGLRGRIVQYGFALWDSRGLGRPWRWRSRKQVWCGLRRPPRWHDANYAAGISSRQQAGWVYATAFKIISSNRAPRVTVSPVKSASASPSRRDKPGRFRWSNPVISAGNAARWAYRLPAWL